MDRSRSSLVVIIGNLVVAAEIPLDSDGCRPEWMSPSMVMWDPN